MSDNGINGPANGKDSNLDLEKLKCNLDAWKKIIDVQQHFNTIEMQIRNFAVTILAGIIAAAGLALREPRSVTIFKLTLSSASALLLAGIIVLISFYFMDRWWYHRLLQGAVKSGELLENELKKTLPNMGMSQKIREESHIKIYNYELTSNRKIDIFYGIIILFLLLAAVGVNNSGDDDVSQPESQIYMVNLSLILYDDIINFTENNANGSGKIQIKSKSNRRDSDLKKTLEEGLTDLFA